MKKIDLKVSSGESKSNVKVERLFSVIVGIIFLLLFILSWIDYIFIPACMIMACLELFSIAYFWRNNKDKRNVVYLLFIVGVILLAVAIVYTCIRTI